MSSFQLDSGVDGRNAVMPIPTIPTRIPSGSSDDLSPSGTLQVMAEWEWGEKQIIQLVLEKGILEPTWDFVPVGNRLRFDLTFLIERATKWKLIEWDLAKLKYYWFTKPYVDLGPILVMLNRGSLSGSS